MSELFKVKVLLRLAVQSASISGGQFWLPKEHTELRTAQVINSLVRAPGCLFHLQPTGLAGMAWVLSQCQCLPLCLSQIWGHPRDGPSGDYSEEKEFKK